MVLSGLQKLTLLDFPGRIAATVFTRGCNMRCPFCHNASLVVGGADVIPEEEFYLDIEKVFDDKNPVNLEHLYKESQQAEGAYFVELKHIREEGKGFKSVEVYKQTEGPGSVWIDTQFTKGFNMLCCKYGMIDSKRPLFIYAEDTMRLIGVVLPIAHHGNDTIEKHENLHL